METSLPNDRIVRTDKETLKCIVKNLLLNAINMTHEGSITLNVDEDKVRHQVVISVSDTAPAIPPEFQKCIFTELPDVNISQLLLTLRVRISKIMARKLGGTLYIDTHEEQGNTVAFTINRK